MQQTRKQALYFYSNKADCLPLCYNVADQRMLSMLHPQCSCLYNMYICKNICFKFIRLFINILSIKKKKPTINITFTCMVLSCHSVLPSPVTLQQIVLHIVKLRQRAKYLTIQLNYACLGDLLLKCFIK